MLSTVLTVSAGVVSLTGLLARLCLGACASLASSKADLAQASVTTVLVLQTPCIEGDQWTHV